MSVNTYPEAPYYDDYDPSKGYVQVLAKAGNYAQSREFSQIGTMMRDQMSNLGDALLHNGYIISGCDLAIEDIYIACEPGSVAIEGVTYYQYEDEVYSEVEVEVGESVEGYFIKDETQKKASLQPGRIYLEGLVRVIEDPLSMYITGQETELVGVKIEETVVTAVEDESLRNPAVGTEGYQQEGASRVKQEIVLTLNDEDAVNLYTLEDGVIQVEEVQSTDDTLSKINTILATRTYETSGNFKVEGLELFNKETDDNTSQIYVGAGNAYIHGYNVRLENMKSVQLTIPQEYSTMNNEPKTYTAVSNKFYFINNPVKQVNQVSSYVTVTEQITRGSTQGGMDVLPNRPVEKIISVVQGSTTYKQGTDYRLLNDSVDWSFLAPAIEPATGSTYTVTYQYIRTNVQDVDFSLKGSGNKQYIQFINSSSAIKPDANSRILIDYDYYLSRRDTICMNQDSEVTVLEGVSDVAQYCVAPANNDPTQLVLGTVLNYANSLNKDVFNLDTVRMTQEDLLNVRNRVDDIEINQAQKDLDDEAKEGEDATDLKGIYTDGFVGYTKADVTHPDYDCSIDIDSQEMTLGYTMGVVGLSMNTSSSNVGVLGRVISSPYTEKKVLSQKKASNKFLVNPYAVLAKQAICTLNPAVDNWIDSSKMTLNSVEYKTEYYYIHQATHYEYETKKSSSTSVMSSAITYMRQRTITVSGSNFQPSEDNIACYFNGKKIAISSPSISGATSNTMKANSNGRVSCKITVPSKTPCGSVEVKLVGPITSGSATYTSNGIFRQYKTVVTTTKITKVIDPLAQSFQFGSDTILTGIDLYFAAKDAKRSVRVQVRDMVNGYPGTTCYAEEELRPSAITANGNKPVATHVSFSQPVYCNANTQYCFAILSDSNVYQVWRATMGQKDVSSKAKITSQPYVAGVMFSSSNGLTWTADQTSDLTFDLYQAKYTGTGTIVFNDVDSINFTRLLLAAETEDHKNAGITWTCKINGAKTWQPIELYRGRELSTYKGTKFTLKATIKVAKSTSPFIANDCINLVYFQNRLSATYVSRMVEFDEVFTNIKVSLEAALPNSGCTLTVFYQINESGSWVQMPLDGGSVKVDEEFDKYNYKVTGVSGSQYRVKVVITTPQVYYRPRVRRLMSILKY